MKRSRELTEGRRLYIPLVGNVVLDLWVEERGSRVRARSTLMLKGVAQTRYIYLHLHEGPFFLSCQSRHIHPRGRFTFPQIISLFFDGSKRDTTKSTSISQNTVPYRISQTDLCNFRTISFPSESATM